LNLVKARTAEGRRAQAGQELEPRSSLAAGGRAHRRPYTRERGPV